MLTSVLEEASAVLAVKARVKGASRLRHAARARGMPIYALKAEGIPQLARAIQAMLGVNARSAASGRPPTRQGFGAGWGVPRTIPILDTDNGPRVAFAVVERQKNDRRRGRGANANASRLALERAGRSAGELESPFF